ncbi:MAG: spore coat associated protein CotJA [Firmicutes bacterium]|nr:spore coat associated protein CotJA [Bacillota bacterium]
MSQSNAKFFGQSDHFKPNANPQCSMPDSMHALGFATVPNQQLKSIYSPCRAITQGTIFPCLDMPYDKFIINRGQ